MKTVETLFLTGKEIAGVVSIADYVDAVERTFSRLAESAMAVPPVVHLPGSGGAFHIKSAGFIGEPHYVAVKVNGNFPGNPRDEGLPTIQGAILLCDARNGALLAVTDSIEVTAMRTGAATAVAARYLAPREARTATVIGCGVQGRVQLLSLMEVLSLERVHVYDVDTECARRFAAAMQKEIACEVTPTEGFGEVTPQSDVIVTCTPARVAFLAPEHVTPGTFIAAVGADNDDKHEIDPALMASARVVTDSTDQCVEIGDLHHAISAGLMSRADVAAELADVVSGGVELDISDHDIVVFDSTGVAIEDVAAAGVIYERARDAGVGRWIGLSA